MKLRTQFSIPAQTSELKKPNPPSKQAKKKAKFKDKTYAGKPNARV
jgi:hypothetical protein